MRPPKVSKALLKDVLRAVPDRAPLGLMRNALPILYLVERDDGALWLMRDGSVSEATGNQTCWAVIPASVVAQAQASRVPLVLEAK